VSKSSSACKPFLEPVLELVLAGIQHDPNLADDMSADGSGDEDDNGCGPTHYPNLRDCRFDVAGRVVACRLLEACMMRVPVTNVSVSTARRVP
jgi:hypothetical protein